MIDFSNIRLDDGKLYDPQPMPVVITEPQEAASGATGTTATADGGETAAAPDEAAQSAKAAPAARKRARASGGTFQADDPATPAVDEAWQQ